MEREGGFRRRGRPVGPGKEPVLPGLRMMKLRCRTRAQAGEHGGCRAGRIFGESHWLFPPADAQSLVLGKGGPIRSAVCLKDIAVCA